MMSDKIVKHSYTETDQIYVQHFEYIPTQGELVDPLQGL